VISVDFITPVVDDPYDFGAIAAANALSDLYAMAAQPLLALNLVGFPAKSLPMSLLGEILQGGAEKVQEAGALLVGGHSIEDYEPKYGMVVAGLVHPEKIIYNHGAKPGDLLVLTKPLGLGIITTGIDRGLVRNATIEKATEVMTTLNKSASEVMRQAGVRAATDVTGFGLLGHLHEMLAANHLGAQIWLDQVPVLEEAWDLSAQGCVPEGSYNNARFLQGIVKWDPHISQETQMVLYDAQTSGGLLMSVSPEEVQTLVAALKNAGTLTAAVIGEVLEPQAEQITSGQIVVKQSKNQT